MNVYPDLNSYRRVEVFMVDMTSNVTAPGGDAPSSAIINSFDGDDLDGGATDIQTKRLGLAEGENSSNGNGRKLDVNK